MAAANPENLPPDLVSFLRDALGLDQRWERLGGMSGARVYRVSSRRSSLVVKLGAREREGWVYRELRPSLEERGVGMPRLEGSGPGWLVLEYIPRGLPRARWVADPDLLGMLRRLHSIPPGDLPLPADGYRPAWTSAMTERVLSLLDPVVRAEVTDRLTTLRPEAEHLFLPSHPISADPNPTNWRVRRDGSLALVDWDRLTLGSPAIDLAITVPGLGDGATYRRVAATYTGDQEGTDELVHAMALAKLWTVVEFLHAYTTEEARIDRETIDLLVQALPGWMRRML